MLPITTRFRGLTTYLCGPYRGRIHSLSASVIHGMHAMPLISLTPSSIALQEQTEEEHAERSTGGGDY